MTNPRKYDLKWIIYIGVSAVFSIAVVLQNFAIQKENADIKHRLDVRDAYFNKGLIDGAKERERALDENRHFAERILEHCRKNPCNLPNDLSILPEQRKFEAIETLLVKPKE